MIIHHATIITMDPANRILENGAIRIQGDTIGDIGTSREILKKYSDPERLDAKGKILMPGLINAHTHLYSAFARGMTLKDAPPKDFIHILERLWWRLDNALDEEAVRLSAFFPLIQAIRRGTTTLIDHHSSPKAIEGSLNVIAQVYEQMGLRGVLCYEVSDRDGIAARTKGIEENRRFLEQCVKTHPSLLRALFGLHASFTLSDESLHTCAEIGRSLNAGFHVHCAEAASDLEYARSHFGKTVVERFHDAEILGPKTIAAHCVHITDKDMDLLRDTKTNIVHNPRSNMNNAVGCAPVMEMVKRGIRVCLGTDGMSSDMMDELKMGILIHKHVAADPRVGWNEMFALLFQNNARLASDLFGAKIGAIEKGAKADAILLDYHPPTPLVPENLFGHILYGFADAPVDSTIVAGRILMQNKVIPGINEEELSARARDVARKVWQRF